MAYNIVCVCFLGAYMQSRDRRQVSSVKARFACTHVRHKTILSAHCAYNILYMNEHKTLIKGRLDQPYNGWSQYIQNISFHSVMLKSRCNRTIILFLPDLDHRPV